MKALGTHDHNAFLARQAAYTKRREKAYIEQNINNDLAYSQRLEELYRETAANIETEIMAQYMRYAGKEGLTMAEARKKVSKMDVEAFAKKAEEYVKNKDFSKDANEQLRAYNLKMRVSRLELMQRTMELEVLKLNGQEEGMLNERLKQSYLDELERQAGILGLDRTERQAVMKNADLIVNGDYQATPFSDRIWTNNRELAARLRVGLERSILRGEHPNKWAKSLQGLLKQEMGGTGKGNALYKARRLAITETARVQIESAKRSFEEAGFEKYIWIAEVDGRQCSVCGAMDDKVFSIKGSTIGANLPPLHPFCRCSVAASMDEDDYNSWLDSIDPAGAGEEVKALNIEAKRSDYSEYLAAVGKGNRKLTKQHQRLSDAVPNQHDWVELKPNTCVLEDLAALTATTGDEYALFQKGTRQIIVHGSGSSWEITGELYEKIMDEKWEWVGHSHPTIYDLRESEADRKTLAQFTWQEESSIIDLQGNVVHFNGEANLASDIDKLLGISDVQSEDGTRAD